MYILRAEFVCDYSKVKKKKGLTVLFTSNKYQALGLP